MKHYVSIIIFLLILKTFYSTSAFGQGKFELIGQINKRYDGGFVKLISQYGDHFSSLQTDIKDGKFQFTHILNNQYQPAYLEVWHNGTSYSINFFIQPKKMQIAIDSIGKNTSFNRIEYNNIPFIEIQNRFNNFIKATEDSNRIFGEYFNHIQSNGDSKSVDSLNKIYSSNVKKLMTKKLEFIKANSDSYFSLFVFTDIFNSTQLNIDTLFHIFSHLSYNIKNSKKGQKTEKILKQRISLQLKNFMPDFAFKDTNGKVFKLSHFRDSQYVLLSFWASWCGPCKRNIPFLKEIATLYKSKGLKLISISVDDDKQKWEAALKEFSMPWIQSCDILEYINSPGVREMYNLVYIPQYFLIHKSGTLIYHNVQLNDDDEHSILKEYLKRELN